VRWSNLTLDADRSGETLACDSHPPFDRSGETLACDSHPPFDRSGETLACDSHPPFDRSGETLACDSHPPFGQHPRFGQHRLPGYRDEAVVRHFDAPEALDMRFYEVRARSALNRVPGASRMPFRWTVNPYRGCAHACRYCFARPTHTYLGFNAGRDFEREIVVKVNAPELLRAELARPAWRGEQVALGTNTDPYQWVEGRYRLMVGIWEALRDARGGAGNPCSVLTKSPLLLRDLPLLQQIAQRTTISASLSIPTLDERAWRATEPHTPNPRARLEAVAELNRAGIPTGVLIAPLMPGINDAPHQLEPLLQGAIDAGARSIGGVALHLRGEVKDVFMEWLRAQRPELVERYEELYRRGAYAPREERERLAGLVRRYAPPGSSERWGAATRARRSAWSGLRPAPADTPTPPAVQQRLF
jgi:DNA repair photolyase